MNFRQSLGFMIFIFGVVSYWSVTYIITEALAFILMIIGGVLILAGSKNDE